MEDLSWRARLARKNINILNIDNERWYYEFMYHPHPGQTKWCKTYYKVPHTHPELGDELLGEEDIAYNIEAEVLSLRKELER